MLYHLSAFVVVFLAACAPLASSAAVIYDGNITDTSQIRSASNNPFFAVGQADVVGVNFAHTGVVSSFVTSGDSVQGIGFDNVIPTTSGPFALSENGVAASLTMSGISLSGRERTQALNATGPDDTVLETVANWKYFVQTNETVTATVSGLTPDTNVFVQVLGGDSGAAWTGQFRVTANGNLVGDWTTVTDEVTSTASLFSFDTTTSGTGTLQLDFQIFTGSYASIAGFMISEEVPPPPPAPEPTSVVLLGLGGLGLMLRRNGRRRSLSNCEGGR